MKSKLKLKSIAWIDKGVSILRLQVSNGCKIKNKKIIFLTVQMILMSMIS